MKGDVGKGAYREEEEDNVDSLFLREAGSSHKVLCHERSQCRHWAGAFCWGLNSAQRLHELPMALEATALEFPLAVA